jgi:hypothetical protein
MKIGNSGNWSKLIVAGITRQKTGGKPQFRLPRPDAHHFERRGKRGSRNYRHHVGEKATVGHAPQPSGSGVGNQLKSAVLTLWRKLVRTKHSLTRQDNSSAVSALATQPISFLSNRESTDVNADSVASTKSPAPLRSENALVSSNVPDLETTLYPAMIRAVDLDPTLKPKGWNYNHIDGTALLIPHTITIRGLYPKSVFTWI